MRFLKIAAAVSAFVFIMLLCGCGQTNSQPGDTGNLESPGADFDQSDYNTEYSAQAAKILFSQSGVSIEGDGAEADKNTAVITRSGDYIVSGQSENGRLIVDAEDCVVHIIFDGLSLECPTSAPVYIKRSDKTIITLSEGTKNYITDGQSYTYDAPEEEEPNAAIFSKDDLTINGRGSLAVKALFNNGIGSKDVLKITGGEIMVEAVDNGLVGRDSLAIDGGVLKISASGDGLRSTNDEDSQKGNIIILSGELALKAQKDGMQAANSLMVAGGRHKITSGGGSAQYSGSLLEEESQKGLKAQNSLNISGGSLIIDSADDALHSNGELNITGGDVTVSTGDDGAHADGTLTVSGGNISVLESYEGLEGLNVNIKGGRIIINAEDDGVNSAGGSDTGGMRPGDGFSYDKQENGTNISIEDGYIFIEASGDGIDSNGSVYMTGGTLLISGPDDGGNGALDYDGSFELSGGILIAAGSSAMAMNVSQAAGQSSILAFFNQPCEAGKFAAITDGQDNLIAAFKPGKSFDSIVFSAPELCQGKSFRIYTGGEAETDACGFARDNYTPGELAYEFVFSSSVMSLGKKQAVSGKMPGGEQQGSGMPGDILGGGKMQLGSIRN